MSKMKYRVVEASEAEELAKKVNELIEDGWEPLGGVAYGIGLDDGTKEGSMQAMTKTNRWVK